MPKNKRPTPKKATPSPEEKDDAIVQLLCGMAIELVEQEGSDVKVVSLQEQEREFKKIIRKVLNQKKDDILYESLEREKYEDSDAYQFLKEKIEEAAGTIVFRHDEANSVEVNAFVIPFFVWSSGGLDRRQCFQDQEAFDVLTKSIQDAQLESREARVVLVNHAYHLDEVDSITFSHLNEMVRNAHASMVDRKMVATPAIERSFFGWPEKKFSTKDVAVELRFLLGFSLKSTDDNFYRVPDDEMAAEQYFDVRTERFQRWTEQIATTIQRCLVTDGRKVDVKFLYQDLFYGAKETGMAEYFMLQTMAELNDAIEKSGIGSGKVKAVIGPVETTGQLMFRVCLYSEAGGDLLVSTDKPLGLADDLLTELSDMGDALQTIGIESFCVAMKFDDNGLPLDPTPSQTFFNSGRALQM